MSLANVGAGVMLKAFVGQQGVKDAVMLQEWEAGWGRAYVDRVVQMRSEIPWDWEDARFLAARRAVFEWMANPSHFGRSTVVDTSSEMPRMVPHSGSSADTPTPRAPTEGDPR